MIAEAIQRAVSGHDLSASEVGAAMDSILSGDASEAQIAAALDIAPGTVKSRLSRALNNLAEILEPTDG